MRLTLNRAFLATFLLWEGYWAYQFFTRPYPDYAMQSVAAIICGIIVPLFVGAVVVVIRLAL